MNFSVRTVIGAHGNSTRCPVIIADLSQSGGNIRTVEGRGFFRGCRNKHGRIKGKGRIFIGNRAVLFVISFSKSFTGGLGGVLDILVRKKQIVQVW